MTPPRPIYREFKFDALRAKKAKPSSKLFHQWKYAQHKLDGHRAIFFVQQNGTLRAYGRDQRPHLELLARYPSLKDHPVVRNIAKLPKYSAVDTEIMTKGAVRSDVVTQLKAEDGDYDIVPFGIPWFRNQDINDQPLEYAHQLAIDNGLPFAPFRYKTDFDPNPAEAINDLIAEAARLNIEGWVLKSQIGGRWWKVKAENEIDCVITGVIDGDGKYAGQIGSIVCSVYKGKRLVEIASSSGMTDSERELMTAAHKAGKLVGTPVELKYQLLGARGRLVHPRFVRFRTDKPAHECTYDQVKDAI